MAQVVTGLPSTTQPTSTTPNVKKNGNGGSQSLTFTPGKTTTYEAAVSKYAPGQAFTYSSVEGRWIPSGQRGEGPSKTEGITTYSQLSPAAKVQLEKAGIISSEAPPPSGATYKYQPWRGTYQVSYTPSAEQMAQPEQMADRPTLPSSPQLSSVGGDKITTLTSQPTQAALPTPFAPTPGKAITGSAAFANLPPDTAAAAFQFGGGTTGGSAAIRGASDVAPRITDVSVTKVTRGGSEFLQFTGLPEPAPTGPTVARPFVAGTSLSLTPPGKLLVPLPGPGEKEAAISKATAEGFAKYQASIPALPGIVALSGEQFASTVRPGLEAQWAANVESLSTDATLKSDALKSLQAQDVQIQRNLQIMATPEYKFQEARAGTFAPSSAEVTRQLQSPFGLYQTGRSAVGPFASPELLGTSIQYAAKDLSIPFFGPTLFAAKALTGSAIPQDVREGIGREAISSRLSLEAAYPQEDVWTQYGKGLVGITQAIPVVGSPVFGVGPIIPSGWMPSETSARALYAGRSPTVTLPASAAVGVAAGSLFTAAPAYITGGARSLGAATGAFEVGTKAITAGKIAQVGIGLGSVALIGAETYKLETATIPTVEARGAKPGEVAGLRAQFYGNLAAGVAGAAAGSYVTRQWLSQKVTPDIVRTKEFGQLKEDPFGTLRSNEFRIETKLGQTRGEIISKAPVRYLEQTFQVKGGQVLLETENLLVKGVKTETLTPLKRLPPQKFGERGESLARRVSDIEAAKILSKKEGVLRFETSKKEYPIYEGTIKRWQASGGKQFEEYQTVGLGAETKTGLVKFGKYEGARAEVPITTEKAIVRIAGRDYTRGSLYGTEWIITKESIALPSEGGFGGGVAGARGISPPGGGIPQQAAPVPLTVSGGAAGQGLASAGLRGGGIVDTSGLRGVGGGPPVSIYGGKPTLISGRGFDVVNVPRIVSGKTGLSQYVIPKLSETTVSEAAAASETIFSIAEGRAAQIASTGLGTIGTLSPRLTAGGLIAPVTEGAAITTRAPTITRTEAQYSLLTAEAPALTFAPRTLETAATRTFEFTPTKPTIPALETPALTAQIPKTEQLTTELTLTAPELTTGLTVGPITPPPFVPVGLGGLGSLPGGGGGGGTGGGGLAFRGFGGRLPRAGKKKEKVGFLSEGISRALFGKATIPSGKTKKGGQLRAVFAGSAELESRGLNVGRFLEKGGFMGSSLRKNMSFKKGIKIR